MSQVSGTPYFFCGKLSQWNYNKDTRSFEIPIATPFPIHAKFVQMVNVEFIGLEGVPDPFILLLHHCIVSGNLNDQQGPFIYFSGLDKTHKSGPIVQLSIDTYGRTYSNLHFSFQLINNDAASDNDPIFTFLNLKLAFQLVFFT